MQIKFLRSNSLGISGTLRNANHHAKKLLPLVLEISNKISEMSFETWFQGHNVHVFRTKDYRNVILRPFGNSEEGYLGIKAEVSLTTRCSEGKGILLAVLYADNRNNVTLDDFINILKTFSLCSKDEVSKQLPNTEKERPQENGEVADLAIS